MKMKDKSLKGIKVYKKSILVLVIMSLLASITPSLAYQGFASTPGDHYGDSANGSDPGFDDDEGDSSSTTCEDRESPSASDLAQIATELGVILGRFAISCQSLPADATVALGLLQHLISRIDDLIASMNNDISNFESEIESLTEMIHDPETPMATRWEYLDEIFWIRCLIYGERELIKKAERLKSKIQSIMNIFRGMRNMQCRAENIESEV